MIFRVRKPIKCALCGEPKGFHKGSSLFCPLGDRSRSCYTDYHRTNTFTVKAAWYSFIPFLKFKH